jgi:hypothetical protein
MLDVCLFARSPWRLGEHVSIRAGLDDGSHVAAELSPDELQRGSTTLVLDRVMEDRRNGFILGAAGVYDQSAYSEEVSKVGNAGSFANLPRMQVDGETQCLDEAGAQDGVGQRAVRQSVRFPFENTASSSVASTSTGEVTDR